MQFLLNDADAINRSIDLMQDDKKLGEISWKEEDGIMHMNHTYVSDQLRGQGMAKKLLDEAASYARNNSLKMNAICSYVVTAFDKYEEYQDVKL